jgi:hypothetical protein
MLSKDDTNTDVLIAAALWLYKWTKQSSYFFGIPPRCLAQFNTACQHYEEANK